MHRILSQDDLVVTHSTVLGPDGPQAVAFDLWQVADSALVGHWGESEPWATKTANGHAPVDGPTAIGQRAERRGQPADPVGTRGL